MKVRTQHARTLHAIPFTVAEDEDEITDTRIQPELEW
jgi:hypothetical protein